MITTDRIYFLFQDEVQPAFGFCELAGFSRGSGPGLFVRPARFRYCFVLKLADRYGIIISAEMPMGTEGSSFDKPISDTASVNDFLFFVKPEAVHKCRVDSALTIRTLSFCVQVYRLAKRYKQKLRHS